MQLHTFEGVPERDDIQSSFFDDIDERRVMNEVVSPSPVSAMGTHLAMEKRNELYEQENETDKEISVYALSNVQTIQDVHAAQQYKNGQSGRTVEILRVMHCSQLTELRGLHLFPNLKELNASSNSLLTMSGLESLQSLRNLNLSCNKLTQVFSLANISKTLVSMNLSHNRIVSLAAMAEFAEIAALEELDLTDNYIGELANLRYLTKFAHLRQLSF